MFSIERSGYYAWLNRSPGKRAKSNEELDKKIIAIFNAHKSRYGAIRIKDELRATGETCSKNRVAQSFFHSIKTELIYTEKYTTRNSAKQSIFHYIEVYYNRVRRHSTIGSIAPMIFEEQARKVA